MNNNMNNERDLTKIFDKRWKVNNETSQKISEQVNDFQQRLHQTDNSVEGQVNRLNQKIESIRANQREKFRK